MFLFNSLVAISFGMLYIACKKYNVD